ncbi:hypothetical protein J6590_018990 [Homalodisca vitripennis]|nr:hypothetical protein J6590_018990 [Homalodisca vitripennis]
MQRPYVLSLGTFKSDWSYKRSITEQVATRVTDKEVAQLSCSARMSYHLIRKSLSSDAAPVCPITWYVQVGLAIKRSITEQVPTRVQIRKSLSSVAAPVCPITWYVQVGLAIEA